MIDIIYEEYLNSSEKEQFSLSYFESRVKQLLASEPNLANDVASLKIVNFIRESKFKVISEFKNLEDNEGNLISINARLLYISPETKVFSKKFDKDFLNKKLKIFDGKQIRTITIWNELCTEIDESFINTTCRILGKCIKRTIQKEKPFSFYSIAPQKIINSEIQIKINTGHIADLGADKPNFINLRAKVIKKCIEITKTGKNYGKLLVEDLSGSEIFICFIDESNLNCILENNEYIFIGLEVNPGNITVNNKTNIFSVADLKENPEIHASISEITIENIKQAPIGLCNILLTYKGKSDLRQYDSDTESTYNFVDKNDEFLTFNPKYLNLTNLIENKNYIFKNVRILENKNKYTLMYDNTFSIVN